MNAAESSSAWWAECVNAYRRFLSLSFYTQQFPTEAAQTAADWRNSHFQSWLLRGFLLPNTVQTLLGSTNRSTYASQEVTALIDSDSVVWSPLDWKQSQLSGWQRDRLGFILRKLITWIFFCVEYFGTCLEGCGFVSYCFLLIKPSWSRWPRLGWSSQSRENCSTSHWGLGLVSPVSVSSCPWPSCCWWVDDFMVWLAEHPSTIKVNYTTRAGTDINRGRTWIGQF